MFFLSHLSDGCSETHHNLFISEVVDTLKMKQNLSLFRFLVLSHSVIFKVLSTVTWNPRYTGSFFLQPLVIAFERRLLTFHTDIYANPNPQNFLFTSRSEDADMKLIDFGLSDFIRTGNNPCFPWISLFENCYKSFLL